LILKVVKVVCFDTLLQVLILKTLTLDKKCENATGLKRHSGEWRSQGRKQKTPARMLALQDTARNIIQHL
jgi:hypothetical protein